MSGWLLLAIGLFVGVSDFLVGRYLATRGPGDTLLYNDGQRMQHEAAARVGRLVMMLAPLFFLVFAALAFGLIPIEVIEPISLGAGG